MQVFVSLVFNVFRVQGLGYRNYVAWFWGFFCCSGRRLTLKFFIYA